MNARRIILWLHRWTGLLSGLVILVVTVTGGLLVFPDALVRWRFPELFPAVSAPERVPVAPMLDLLRAQHPDARVQGLRMPRNDSDALMLFTASHAMHFDPHTGRMLGSRPRQDLVMQSLIRLHVNLMMGPDGARVVVIATIITLGLALTGLWLWWPLRIGWFRRGGNFRRFNLDLHSVAGLYSSLFLLVIGTTGITMKYLHGLHPAPPAMRAPSDNLVAITLDDAIRGAELALPGARAAAMEIPPAGRNMPFRVQLAFPEDGSPAGRSVVFINPITGEPLAVHSSRSGSLMQIYQNNQLSLHTGAIGGNATRWVAILVCVALVLQIASGFVLWLKKR